MDSWFPTLSLHTALSSKSEDGFKTSVRGRCLCHNRLVHSPWDNKTDLKLKNHFTVINYNIHGG